MARIGSTGRRDSGRRTVSATASRRACRRSGASGAGMGLLFLVDAVQRAYVSPSSAGSSMLVVAAICEQAGHSMRHTASRF
jgi:hypothetical protein